MDITRAKEIVRILADGTVLTIRRKSFVRCLRFLILPMLLRMLFLRAMPASLGRMPKMTDCERNLRQKSGFLISPENTAVHMGPSKAGSKNWG